MSMAAHNLSQEKTHQLLIAVTLRPDFIHSAGLYCNSYEIGTREFLC